MSCSQDMSSVKARRRGKRKARRSVRESRWAGAQSKSKVLEPVIWSRTPQDIQLLLLNFLPLTSLCRFRCVSRSWRSVIATIIPTSPRPWLLSINCELRIFNGFKWRNFGKVPLPPEAPEKPRFVRHVSTSAGLVLATHSEELETCWLSVHNPFVSSSARLLGPLTRLRDLPDYSADRLAFTGIQALSSSVSSDGKIPFAAVCVTSGEQVLVHVFDSRSWSWVVECARVPGLGCFLADEPVLYQGRSNFNSLLLQDERLYFLTTSKNDTRSLKCVDIWNPEHTCKTLATWTDLPLSLHQNSYRSFCDFNHPSLISCQGKLMLVNMIPSPPYGAIGFLYLDEESRSWRELTSFPMHSFPDKVKRWNIKADLTACVWAAGSPQSSKVALYFAEPVWGCVFDLADSTWRPVFPCDAEMLLPFHPSFLTF